MRIFIAVPFSEENKKDLKKIQEKIKKKSKGGRFSDPKNFHLTLKFIGEVPEEKLEEVKGALGSLTQKATSFSLALEGFGTFEKGRTHIPWLGVTKGYEALKDLQEEVEQVLYDLGYKKESRPFQPHMTFGRKVQLSPSDIGYLQEILKTEKIPVEVQSLALMESTRIDGRLAYPILEEFPLLHKR